MPECFLYMQNSRFWVARLVGSFKAVKSHLLTTSEISFLLFAKCQLHGLFPHKNLF